jgi:hypothetical protein
MKNIDRANKLLSEADTIFSEIEKPLKSKNWNLAIRRAQEVVELVLKAMLTELGIEYPKIHDIAPLFKKVVEERKIRGYGKFLDWLVEFSADLASKRAPAFYFEAEYKEEDASSAVDGAKRVIDFGKSFIISIRSKHFSQPH